MITADIYTYLSQDVELAQLLKASGDSKIYPNIAKITGEPPFIVYRAATGAGKEEILQQQVFSFIVTAKSFEEILAVSARLAALLDGMDDVPSQNCYIHNSKRITTHDDADDLGRNVRRMDFNFIFTKKQEIL